jgi:hypothetical protein
MGAASGFCEASWEVYIGFYEALEKPLVASIRLKKQMLNTTARGFRAIYDDFKALLKG